MLLLDRYLGAHFFDTQAGGSAVIWMHFFWIFGHPEVYILVLPAFAILSEVIPVFSRKPIFGYNIMVAATLAIGFISLGVWAHHMFTVGMTSYANAFFVASTAAIAVPTGIKIFNWLGTMWGGKLIFITAMLFCVAAVAQMLIAGLTGIMLAAAPFDWQLGNSYFVIAHFHYVILGVIVFAVFAASYYWYPKITGRLMNETLGKWHFWLFLIGFHVTFDFMHIPGILGMPRRIYTYEASRGWEVWNLIVSVGVLFQIVAILCWVVNLLWSVYKGPKAGNDPWDAWTLEWSTTSPPPDYNFAIVPDRAQPTSAVGLEASGRSGLEVRVEETAFGSTEHCAETTRDAAGARTARPRRHVVPDRRGVGYLQHLRGCLPLLRGQEPERAISQTRCCTFRCSTRFACSPRASPS